MAPPVRRSRQTVQDNTQRRGLWRVDCRCGRLAVHRLRLKIRKQNARETDSTVIDLNTR